MQKKIEFADEEFDKVSELINLYHEVKKLILYGEEADPEKRTHLQTINELRNSLDHLMRTFAFKFGLKPDETPEYVLMNMDKAIGHVYRAGYDALDWIVLVQREIMEDSFNGVSHKAISEIFPEWYREIKPDLINLSDKISKIRADKDVIEKYRDPSEFNKYLDVVDRLKEHSKKVVAIKPSLIEYDEKEKLSQRKSSIYSFIKNLISK